MFLWEWVVEGVWSRRKLEERGLKTRKPWYSLGCSCSCWRTEDAQEDGKVRVERKVMRQMSVSLMNDRWRIGGHSRAGLRKGKGKIKIMPWVSNEWLLFLEMVMYNSAMESKEDR